MITASLFSGKDCDRCSLHGKSITHNVPPRGSEKPSVYFVGIAPGYDEDKQGKCFVGRSGELLAEMLKEHGINGVRLNNVVSCAPYKKPALLVKNPKYMELRDPSPDEIKCCFSENYADIERHHPKLVVLLGNIPLKVCLNKTGISSCRGQFYKKNGLTFFPTFHPAYILRYPGYKDIWREDFRKIKEFIDGNISTSVKKDYSLVTEDTKIFKVIEYIIENVDEISLDIETNTTDVFEPDAKILTVALSFKENTAICFTVNYRDYHIEDLDKFKALLQEMFNTTRIVGQNLKFEYMWFKHLFGVDMRNIGFDTMLAHYCLNPRRISHSLDKLVADYIPEDAGYSDELYECRKKENGVYDYEQIPLDILYKYNCYDADVTLKLKNILSKSLQKDDGAHYVFKNILLPDVIPTAIMELNGIRIDEDKRQELFDKYSQESDQILNRIYSCPEIIQTANIVKEKYKSESFNLNSSRHLRVLLYDVLKLPILKRTRKTGKPSTDENVLVKLESQHNLLTLILAYKKSNKVISTFLSPIIEYVRSDGRIHPNINIIGTVTLRQTYSNPNLQQIPKRGDGINIREMFSPADGYLFVKADYDQLELRILAQSSKDSNLLDAYRNNIDVHSLTASLVFGIDESEVTKELRSFGKMCNFGIVYGITEFGLADRFKREVSPCDLKKIMAVLKKNGIPIEYDKDSYNALAKTILKHYFKMYPGVKRYMDNQIEFARKSGYVVNLWGWKIPVDGINSDDEFVRGEAERIAMNAPIQSSAAPLIQLAKRTITDFIFKTKIDAKIVLTVHDEIVIECEERIADYMTKVTKYIMENVPVRWKWDIPLIASVGIGKDWKNIKDLEILPKSR